MPFAPLSGLVVRANYENSVRKGRPSQTQCEQRMALLRGSTDYDDLAKTECGGGGMGAAGLFEVM